MYIVQCDLGEKISCRVGRIIGVGVWEKIQTRRIRINYQYGSIDRRHWFPMYFQWNDRGICSVSEKNSDFVLDIVLVGLTQTESRRSVVDPYETQIYRKSYCYRTLDTICVY